MFRGITRKNLHTWLPGYGVHLAHRVGTRLRGRRQRGPRHLLFSICDHYEPLWKGKAGEGAGKKTGLARVRRWSTDYPKLAEGFRDSTGRRPRHTFFFPGEEYAPSFLEELAQLARHGYGEVELHLHHDNDNATNLRLCIEEYLELFAEHGHVSRTDDGDYRYAFIHGNWCLANAREDGRWCGVDDELQVLFDTGCYADFTFPSAPDPCQPPLVNQFYWPTGDLSLRRSYQNGERAQVGNRRSDRLLMITGPLALTLRSKTIKPRIESSALDAGDPPTRSRIDSWVRQNIHVAGQPNWVFVKVHTHGAPENNANCLLGEPGANLHRILGGCYNDGSKWRLHYVTAREMYNVAAAAMDGQVGDPSSYYDYDVPPPPIATRRTARSEC